MIVFSLYVFDLLYEQSVYQGEREAGCIIFYFINVVFLFYHCEIV